MLNNKEILTSIVKSAQMGQAGIRSVLKAGMEPELRKALKDQLREYRAIESEAHSTAAMRGWELKELDPALLFMVENMSRLKLGTRGSQSKIADMMIQGSTQGMIQGLRDIHQYKGSDSQVRILSQKLLDCEAANIRQMQSYL